LSWISKTNAKSGDVRGFSGLEEEHARAAILEKVMKGRQPTDLMLRCEYFQSWLLIDIFFIYVIGTILNSEGNYADENYDRSYF
jgi:hypothetical protein